jgi:hypothetical protein
MSESMKLSGPMFEPASSKYWRKVESRGYESGAHYSVFGCQGRDDGPLAEEALRLLFPDGKANEYTFVLFSTSGVHGCYTTLEEIEASFKKYGADAFGRDEETPDDYERGWITFLVVHPRTVTLRYGNAMVRPETLEWFKRLRASSWDVVQQIGRGDESTA